jgi:hypothetical protein
MKWYCHTDAPLSLHGTINSRFERMPAQACDVSDRMRPMYQRSPGARLRFVTDASTLQIELTYAQKPVYGANLSLIAASSADCYCGSGQQARFLGLCSPASIDQMQAQATIVTQLTAPALVTVALPSRAPLTQVRIGVNDLAQMLPPPPYTYPAPVLFYGSSITGVLRLTPVHVLCGAGMPVAGPDCATWALRALHAEKCPLHAISPRRSLAPLCWIMTTTRPTPSICWPRTSLFSASCATPTRSCPF